MLVAAGVAGSLLAGVPARGQETPSSPDVRAVAEEAAVFGFPLVENYRFLYEMFADTTSGRRRVNTLYPVELVPELQNELAGTFDVGTRFCLALLDLRVGPMVLTVPHVSGRYYSFQLVDMLTDNFAYVGTRATGTRSGNYVVIGPGWKGRRPFAGEVSQVLPAPSWLVLIIGRMELRDVAGTPPKQAWTDFRIQSLEQYYGKQAPTPLPLEWPLHADPKTCSAAEFFGVLNFMMQWQVFLPSEAPFLSTLSKIGVVAGKPFSIRALGADGRQSMEEGLSAARERIRAASDSVIVMNHRWGTLPREEEALDGGYLPRAAMSWKFLYMNGPEETLYFATEEDSLGALLDGSTGSYSMVFEEPPPTRFFWSLSVLDRGTLKLEAGSVRKFRFGRKDKVFQLSVRERKKYKPFRVVLQTEDPGEIEDGQWLQVPDGPFVLVLRVFGPAPGEYTRTYVPPAVFPRPAG